jgi:LmbE family N-acetylglucosaminyl deacetylase
MRLPRSLTRVAARAKPVVPQRAWPVLLALRSLGGEAPLIAEPAFRRPLVVAAHPDDESLGCAGTLALLTRRGASPRVAFATDGEATRGAATPAAETARRRRVEATAACRELGVDEVAFWGLPDGGLAGCRPALADRITSAAAEADGVMLPWFLDGHPDHEALSAALADARVQDGIEVWGFETWVPLPANRLVDVTAVWDRKQAAIAAHVTANLAFELDAALGLNRWRAIHGLMGRGYAEAFLAAPVADYLAIRSKVMA